MKNKTFKSIAITSTLVWSLAGATASVISVSTPVNSQDPLCRPSYDNIWTVTVPPFPFNTNSGIGIIMNPSWTPVDDNQDFALHQNNHIQPSPLYVAPNVPDPTTAIVTYTFDQAEVISGVEIVQHLNGITEVEGFLGESTNTLVSLGSVFGPSGDITDGSFVVPAEGTPQVFNFGNTDVSGTVFQVIIRKTSYPTAFATHRMYPLDASGTPIPVASGLVSVIWTSPAPITYGTALSSKQLNASANVPASVSLVGFVPPPIINIPKAVYLTSTNLLVGVNYQVQASSDLINWTNQGSPFTATNSNWQSTNYWNVNDWNQLFFQLQVVP